MTKRKNITYLQKRFFYLFVLNLFSVSLWAQLNSGNLTQLTEKDGLSSNTINAMLVDKQGYLWVSTYNGLARYNGYEFEKFYSDPNDTSAIQGMIAYRLMQDSKENIWVGTNPGFIEVYNPVKRTFSAFDYSVLVSPFVSESPQYGYVVTSICEDKKGNIYFGITASALLTKGLLFKEAESEEITLFKTPDNLEIQNVYDMKPDLSGNIWLLSNNGVFKIDTTGVISSQNHLFINFPVLQDDFVTDFEFTEKDNAWLLTQFGNLIKWNWETGTFKTIKSPYYTNDPVGIAYNMTKDDKGILWIATRSGVRQFNPETEEFKTFDTGAKKQLENLNINCFAYDTFGNLFIGTANNGILRYDEKPVFTSYVGDNSNPSTILPGWVNVIIESHDNNIWIHSNAGISVLNQETGKVENRIPSTDSLQFSWIHTFWEDSPGVFIFSFGSGVLFEYKAFSNSVKQISLPGISEGIVITKHLHDSKGNKWIATREGLFRKTPELESFKKYDLSLVEGADSVSNDITSLVESSKYGLWIVTNFGLFLYNYDSDQIERHAYDINKGGVLMSQDINSLYEDSDGVVWVGQWQGGLAKYIPETGQVIKYNLDSGLPSMGVQSITADDNGMIWLSTFNGISRLNPETEQFSNFSIDDGIQGSLFADGSFLKTTSGQIIFGGANGITLFNPDDFKIDYQPPKVFFTDLKLFNQSVIPGPDAILDKPVYQTKQIELSHKQNNLTISFIALNYSNPLKNRYSYILENYDIEWRESVSQRDAFYPNLPPGNYTFKVKAANEKGIWNETGATLQIRINPPWWNTIWAYIIYALLILVFAVFLNRYMRNRLIQKEREKAQKKELEQAREIEKAYKKLEVTHENLKATQTQLIQSEKMASLGELTAGIAHEIQNPLNFVNNFSDINKELIVELKEELAEGNLQLANDIANDIDKNEEKINHHGKRAETIVKGMLLHSRTNSGEKTPTDINALCDEYLRLSYHGLRAKDKSFNADFKLNADNTIPKINVVPQDIGRVLLNLINNAFYVVNEKVKHKTNGYQPIVLISTALKPVDEGMETHVEIRIQDNGPGIPDEIKDKIFQPFFTTKPTGSGTGLGLSLSYDIIKAHGGSISVKSDKKEGTEFIIQIPQS